MRLLALTGLVGALVVVPGVSPTSAADACATPVVNPVACENTKAGSPQSEWGTVGAGADTIQGFATDISVNVGSTIQFKVKTPSNNYVLDIYRMGWYGGSGARKITSITPSVSLPQSQPTCLNDPTTNLYDCGNWKVSASWGVPSTAVSGIYFAHLVRRDVANADSQIVFVVRNDASRSDVLYQTSDTTWQAYNTYGGASLYPGPIGRAYKVSYNRPFTTGGTTPEDWVMHNEYAMVRFMERNGYDVSYFSGVDTDRRGNLLLNHKTFMSVGHDEYWSGNQRANVTAARDAGVNLAFFSGNEMYWKTRWEPSIDGTSTAYRTLVTYKETLDRAKTDPTSTWTGTWRDPRYSSDGGLPENGLTGTAYKVNCCQYAPTVPAADGKLRLWRNTSVATLAAGTQATLTNGMLGIEWDEDLDNGFRPAGLIHLSTTNQNVPQYMADYGNTVVAGPATHHFTLYRAASGALVFGAGTINYSWGLDDQHTTYEGQPSGAPDQRVQQATVNLFADMGVQPSTLMSGLVPATKSTDTTKPTSVITSPGSGASLGNGASVTVTGTAADVGGRVAGVEVSLDGGTTWHPASGRETWTYTGVVGGVGPTSIRSRATDDSANTENPSAGVAANVSCPCSIYGSTAPGTAATTDATAIEAGVKFRANIDGWVTGVRFYKGTGNSGAHTGSLWSTNGTRLATALFSGETASGWQQVAFPQAIHVTAGTTYIASYFAPNGRYAADSQAFIASGVSSPPLRALRDGEDGPNGVYGLGAGFPDRTFGSTSYGVDVLFTNVEPPDVTAPTITSKTPLPGSSSVDVNAAPAVAFDETVQASTISMTVKNPAGTSVPGTTTYTAGTKTATFTPTSPLAKGTTFTVSVSGAKDTSGNTMVAASYTFTTVQPSTPGVCPCGIWDETATPADVTVVDPNGVELGVKFRAEVDGKVTGIQFYKGPKNVGTHTGSLWTTSGTRLVNATFSGESTAGWQTVTFATPVDITAGTTYIASYYTTGFYSATAGGLSSAVSNSPLTALGDGDDGANGVYVYGAGGVFPNKPGNRGNYWVDVVFSPPPDVTPPSVSSSEPGADAYSVPVASLVQVTFNEPVNTATAVATLETSTGASVATTKGWSANNRTLTLTPTAPLTAARTYRVRISGATDGSGNTMSAQTWTFKTTGAGACPCGIWSSSSQPGSKDSGDTNAVELGVKIRATADGWIYGVRFYKSAANTGTHTGSLWATNGQRLATATFTNETASGWQNVSFAQPVQVQAGTTYIASYHTNTGHYASDSAYFSSGPVQNGPVSALANGTDGPNGVYLYSGGNVYPDRSFNAANYWVDIAYSDVAPPDTAAPVVTSTSPNDGASSVPTGAAVSATFNELIATGGLAFTLRLPDGSGVSGSVGYDSATRTATFTPAAPLAAATTYTARVSGASDGSGNTMTALTWTFKTAAAPGGAGSCPCSIWDEAIVPGSADSGDSTAIEVGVKFTANVAGVVNGVRFYKSAANTGSHTGSLWGAAGNRLATATFSGESTSGWQEVQFSSPVPVTAGTTYIVSYFAPNGHYSADGGYFSNAGVLSGPLRALQNGDDGGNGVYNYGSAGFPANTYGGANYWVDVVFSRSG